MTIELEIITSDILDLDPDSIGDKCNYLLSDIPYGIGMMQEKWDTDICFKSETWEHLSRFLVEGSMISIYSQPKTMFSVGTALEQANLITQGMIAWLHLSGFTSAAKVNKKDEDSAWYNYRYGSDSLRPIFEPVILAQKPFSDSKAQYKNILDNHSGVYNIDAGRLDNGKYPPNMMVSHHPDCQAEFCHVNCPTASIPHKSLCEFCQAHNWQYNELEYLFYTKKPSKREKEAGLEQFPDAIMQRMNKGGFSDDPKFRPKVRKNPHRTVKPITAGKYLASLFKPPESEKNRVFIPFCGTGSEIIGAMLAGWKRILAVEVNPYYSSIAKARCEFWADKLQWGYSDVNSALESLRKPDNQMILF